MLIALVALASLGMAQVQGVFGLSKNQMNKTTQISTTKEAPVWSLNFEEDPAVWSFGSVSASEMAWQVTDETGVPSAWGSEGAWYFQPMTTVEAFEDAGNWAWIDGVEDLLNGTFEIINAYVLIENIDLTGVTNPKLIWNQLYRPLNAAYSYIEVSVDGGANWETFQVNGDVEGNEYGPIQEELNLTSVAANQANVSLRFRWETTDLNGGGYGYGWQIDELVIVENPPYDLVLEDARMNFFDYVDYTQPENADYFHISSHYGQITNEQMEEALAAMWFNVMVKSVGFETSTPDVNVTVLDPFGGEIYNETVTANTLNTNDLDTVDLIDVDFMLLDGFAPGEYTVIYSVSETGITDPTPGNNVDTTYFNLTDTIMGRDLGNPTSRTGPSTWMDGGVDGEMFGTDYTFLYDTEITSMWVYIGSGTTEGTAVVAHVMEYDATEEDWVDMGTSSLYTIAAGDIENWVEFTFADEILVELGEDDGKSVMAAIEFYYNGEDNDIYIGYDASVTVSFWGTKWYLMQGSNAQSWVSITNWSRGGVALRLETADQDPEWIGINDDFVSEDVNIYPNPTTGLLNITNVAGASVSVYNLMGQVIATIESTSNLTTIDMSSYSEGTYIVRIVNGAEVTTQKVNIVR